MDNSAVSHEELIRHLSVLADSALGLWDLPPQSKARLINVSENATFIIVPGDFSKKSYFRNNTADCQDLTP